MKRTLVVIMFFAVVLFCIPSAAQATATTFTLTSAGHIVDDNYYVGPYTASITGGSTLQIICDNFNTNVHLGLTPNPLYASQEYITVAPVPEPSTVLLFGIGLLTLGVTLRRKLRSRLT
jgi:PEP-CTERM motif-containing protein